VEIFRVRSDEEIKRRQQRRKKRAKEKQAAGKEKKVDAMDVDENKNEEEESVDIADQFTPYLIIRTNGKIRSFDYATTETSTKGGVHVSSLPIQSCQSGI